MGISVLNVVHVSNRTYKNTRTHTFLCTHIPENHSLGADAHGEQNLPVDNALARWYEGVQAAYQELRKAKAEAVQRCVGSTAHCECAVACLRKLANVHSSSVRDL